MNLTPLEIKKQTFDRGLRGYDTSEVEAYLSMLSNEWDQLLRRNEELEAKIQELSDKVRHYEKVEQALQQTLSTAKESATQKTQEAEREATGILNAAKDKANAFLSASSAQLETVRDQIHHLIQMRKDMVVELESVLEHMQSTVQTFAEHQSVFSDPSEELELFEIPEPVETIEYEVPRESVSSMTPPTPPPTPESSINTPPPREKKRTYADIDDVLDSLDI